MTAISTVRLGFIDAGFVDAGLARDWMKPPPSSTPTGNSISSPHRSNEHAGFWRIGWNEANRPSCSACFENKARRNRPDVSDVLFAAGRIDLDPERPVCARQPSRAAASARICLPPASTWRAVAARCEWSWPRKCTIRAPRRFTNATAGNATTASCTTTTNWQRNDRETVFDRSRRDPIRLGARPVGRRVHRCAGSIDAGGATASGRSTANRADAASGRPDRHRAGRRAVDRSRPHDHRLLLPAPTSPTWPSMSPGSAKAWDGD